MDLFEKVSGNDLEIVLISVFYSLILMRKLFRSKGKNIF